MTTNTTVWDTLIQGALVFDGSGELPEPLDIAIKAGNIVAKGTILAPQLADSVIDARGKWLMPGLLDIHTHLDLEVDIDPRLPEVVRHGTTTVLIGNCSLGTCFGQQIEGEQNPIVDCFTRVENIPKSVLRKCVEVVTWDNTQDYMDHFAKIPLGPNVASFVPHSMLRIEAMGLEASISRDPTDAELQKMLQLLEQALKQGFIGMSTDGLPFHYLSNAPNTDKRIPTQFAKFAELKQLLSVVRKYDRVWQTTPIIENRPKAFLYFLLSSGRLFGKTLKTSALSAMEFALMPKASNAFLAFAKLVNSRLLKGNMHFQALGSNFRVWSDGIVSPLFEELDSTAQLIAKEYDDVDGRKALMDDPAFVEQFRHDWYHGRQGNTLAHLKTKLGLPDSLVIRELDRMIFDKAPVTQWHGESLQAVMERAQQFKRGDEHAARSDEEQQAFLALPTPIKDDADFMLNLLKNYDKGFRYWVDVANIKNKATLEFLLHDQTLPGFNDSGAHITNMAFYDSNLTSIRLAQKESLATVSKIIHRLTQEPAAFFGLDVGTLKIGAQADITIIDPATLAIHDSDAHRQIIYRDIFEHDQMVNRSDGVVSHVFINGECVWQDDQFEPVLGSKTLGRALRAGH